jgi:hypothetical protein
MDRICSCCAPSWECQHKFWKIRACIHKFPDWVDNEINHNINEQSLRNNTKGYGSKTHYSDSQNSNTTAGGKSHATAYWAFLLYVQNLTGLWFFMRWWSRLILNAHIRRPFAKFVDSSYYSESELLEVRWRYLFRSTEYGVAVVLKEPSLGWRSNLSGASALRDWKVAIDGLTEIGGSPLEHPPYSPDLAPRDFRAFPTMKRELRGKKFRSDQRFAARFREVGGAL